MALVRSILFALLFYLGSLVIVPLGAILGLFWTPAIRGTARLWANWFRLLLPVLGIRVVGVERPLVGAAQPAAASLATGDRLPRDEHPRLREQPPPLLLPPLLPLPHVLTLLQRLMA